MIQNLKISSPLIQYNVSLLIYHILHHNLISQHQDHTKAGEGAKRCIAESSRWPVSELSPRTSERQWSKPRGKFHLGRLRRAVQREHVRANGCCHKSCLCVDAGLRFLRGTRRLQARGGPGTHVVQSGHDLRAARRTVCVSAGRLPRHRCCDEHATLAVQMDAHTPCGRRRCQPFVDCVAANERMPRRQPPRR